MAASAAFVVAAPWSAPLQARSLVESIRLALETNPEIGQAVANREAVEFELIQAQGLFAPRVDLEASVGIQRYDTPARRAAGIADDPLYPARVGLNLNYDLLDGGARDAQVATQTARVSGAEHRVAERSELVALEIARIYFEVVLQRRILDLSRQNVAFHQMTLDNVSAAASGGQLTEADRFQAIERLAASRARVVEAQEELGALLVQYERYVGEQLGTPTIPGRPVEAFPASLDEAVSRALIANPMILLARSDADAANAQVRQAEAGVLPKLSLQAGASAATNFGGVVGETYDTYGRLALTWNLYDGGVRPAQIQESLRRENEALLGLHQAGREVSEAVSSAWIRMVGQREVASVYRDQLDASAQLIEAYQEQFDIGERTLLDLLDAQNTRHNLQVLHETAQYSARFAEYRVMAASGSLLSGLGLSAPRTFTALTLDPY